MIDAIILAGGKGERLRPVITDLPKPLAPIGTTPFLTLLLKDLDASKIVRSVTLAIGYLGDKIRTEYENKGRFTFPIRFSLEKEPLGTAGAVRLALDQTTSDDLLVLNGDSFTRVDLAAVLSSHKKKKANVTIVLRLCDNASRFGLIKVDPNQNDRILEFTEKKTEAKSGLINAGIYIISRKILSEIPIGKPTSLEKDIFPKLLKNNSYGFVTDGKFIDIGIPETYLAASEYLKEFLN